MEDRLYELTQSTTQKKAENSLYMKGNESTYQPYDVIVEEQTQTNQSEREPSGQNPFEQAKEDKSD
jgi:hypothetical protein